MKKFEWPEPGEGPCACRFVRHKYMGECEQIEWCGMHAKQRDETAKLRAAFDELRRTVFTNGDRKMTMEGRVFTVSADGFISDQNFDFDAGMQVTGDFVDDEKRQYAEMIASVLNAHTLTPNA